MATLCVSCGLETDPNGRLQVATSGSWGSGALGFPCDDEQGAPIYCDEHGRLRTTPEHTATRLFDNGVAFPQERSLSAGNDWFTPVTLTYRNPSTCRSMWFMAHARAEATYRLQPGSAFRLRGGIPTVDTPSGGGVDLARDSQAPSEAVRVVTVTGNPFGTLLVPPGGTVTINTSMTTSCLSGEIQIIEHRYWWSTLGVTV